MVYINLNAEIVKSLDSEVPIVKALETQKTLRRTKYFISGYYINAYQGVIMREIVTLD